MKDDDNDNDGGDFVKEMETEHQTSNMAKDKEKITLRYAS